MVISDKKFFSFAQHILSIETILQFPFNKKVEFNNEVMKWLELSFYV